MGFSLTFQGIGGDGIRDADREGLARFLDDRGLTLEPGDDRSRHLLDASGDRLQFDGEPTDLHLHPLDTSSPVCGGIWHATLSEAELGFVYDLCCAAHWLVVNHQPGAARSAMFVVPNANHTYVEVQAVLPEPDIAFIDNAVELGEWLTGDHARFADWRARALGDGA